MTPQTRENLWELFWEETLTNSELLPISSSAARLLGAAAGLKACKVRGRVHACVRACVRVATVSSSYLNANVANANIYKAEHGLVSQERFCLHHHHQFNRRYCARDPVTWNTHVWVKQKFPWQGWSSSRGSSRSSCEEKYRWAELQRSTRKNTFVVS